MALPEPEPQPVVVATPWMTRTQAAAYIQKSPKFLMKEINAGRLRAARVGSGRQILTCAAWCDEWVARASEVHPFRPRRV